MKENLKKEKDKNLKINLTVNSLEEQDKKKNIVLENLEANVNFLKNEMQLLETQLQEKVIC